MCYGLQLHQLAHFSSRKNSIWFKNRLTMNLFDWNTKIRVIILKILLYKSNMFMSVSRFKSFYIIPSIKKNICQTNRFSKILTASCLSLALPRTSPNVNSIGHASMSTATATSVLPKSIRDCVMSSASRFSSTQNQSS